VADGETGLLCEPGRDDALAAAAIDLLADRDRLARMGVRARQRAALSFSLERYVDQYDELLRRLAWSAVPEATTV
jgi:glycosyltransferase involved in cell wall biosynthesis